MKHPRRLTLREKKLLAKEGHDPAKYLRIKRTAEYLEFLNIETKKTLPVRW